MTHVAGIPGISLRQMQSMIAASPTFRAEAGGTESAARRHVHTRRQQGVPQRPFALITLESVEGESNFHGSANLLRPSGSAHVHFERATDITLVEPEFDAFDAFDWFGRVVDEINAQAGTDDPDSEFGLAHLPMITLTIQGETIGENPRNTWRSLGRFFQCDAVWTWGDA